MADTTVQTTGEIVSESLREALQKALQHFQKTGELNQIQSADGSMFIPPEQIAELWAITDMIELDVEEVKRLIAKDQPIKH